jgi:adenosylcobinamide-phosphate synthase
VVGDFEDAVYCWRMQAALWPDKFLGIILASGAGALGVRLGESLPYRGIIDFRPELGLGDEANADYLQSAVGLVWRVLILMLGLLVLLTFAHWLGR